MGKIARKFGQLSYRNEAEVSQNFVYPLFTEFLGYSREEIKPEHLLSPIFIPTNRGRATSSAEIPARSKPDYLVCVEDNKYIFVCDSKAPAEDIDEYLPQIKAYSIASGANLVLITNGIELKIYDANRLIFHARSVEELDIKSGELSKLLARRNVIARTELERIQSLDLAVALDEYGTDRPNLNYQNTLKLSDYIDYLKEIASASQLIDIPEPIREAFNIDFEGFERFPSDKLYHFKVYKAEETLSRLPGHDLIYHDLLQTNDGFHSLLLIGESGIGKSTLTTQLLYDMAHSCLDGQSSLIPVLVKLGHYTPSSQSIWELIHTFLLSRKARIDRNDLAKA